MKLSKNYNCNRYTWAQNTLQHIRDTFTKDTIALFDIGSRDGVLKSYCTNLKAEYSGFDLEPLTDDIRKWNIEQPFPYMGKADIITFLEVIEHLNNPWLSFKNLNEVLEPKGYILITTPNPEWSNARIELLFKGKLTCFTESDLELNHHVFTPWPHIVERLLMDTGFKVIEYATIDGKTEFFKKPMGGLRFPGQFLYRSVKKLIELNNPAACGMSYAILAQKI